MTAKHFVRLSVLIASLGIVFSATAQTVIDTAALEKQQDRMSDEATILHANFLAFWLQAYPNGAPFQIQDRSESRLKLWNPSQPQYKETVRINDGMGCVIFMSTAKPPVHVPDVCAPLPLRAWLVMEVLRQDWDNLRNVPTEGENFQLLNVVREGLPDHWIQEKAVYCTLKPEAQYIDLSSTLQDCTPKDNR